MQAHGVVLVEGTSDRHAVETLARRRGRDLRAEGVAIVPMGGYGNLPRLLGQYRDVPLAGLYDAGEERHFLRALGCDDRGELEARPAALDRVLAHVELSARGETRGSKRGLNTTFAFDTQIMEV